MNRANDEATRALKGAIAQALRKCYGEICKIEDAGRSESDGESRALIDQVYERLFEVSDLVESRGWRWRKPKKAG